MARTLPAEWTRQDGVLLIWPHASSDWNENLEATETAFAALALALARFGLLILVCHDETTRDRALTRLKKSGAPSHRLMPVVVPSNDTWARDIAPITVFHNGGPRCIDGNFNGWGGKYPHADDHRFARRLLNTPPCSGLERERSRLVLEGGSIDSDGAGVLMINQRTVIDPARNPGLDRAEAERHLHDQFGIRQCLWFDVPPVPGDDTDGHIDTLARFTESGAIACAAPHSPADPAASMLEILHAQLATLTGSTHTIVELPGPKPFTRVSGEPCPATYANFLVVNRAVLVPAYGDANDIVAMERLQACFPGRTIVPVPARLFVQQAGSLHCLTMQWPEGTLYRPE